MIEHDRILSERTEPEDFVTDRAVRPRSLPEFVDQRGLDQMDQKLFLTLIQMFQGGPVGIDTIAAAIGKEVDTVEDTIEPYLIQQGLLMRTPRGRKVTAHAYRAMGFDASPTTPAIEECPCA